VAVVVAVPAMTVVMVLVASEFDDNLCVRRGNQRRKEHQHQESKQCLFHTVYDARHGASVVHLRTFLVNDSLKGFSPRSGDTINPWPPTRF
jgi:hypothetical protein